jgi:thioredoxin 1
MSGAAIDRLTDSTFDAEAKNGWVVIEFGARWCMPCRMLEPVIRQLAASYADQVRVMTVDTDEESELTERFSVSTVPTILILHNGELIRRFVGLTTFERLASTIEISLQQVNESTTGT